jgi:hypothetical protein
MTLRVSLQDVVLLVLERQHARFREYVRSVDTDIAGEVESLMREWADRLQVALSSGSFSGAWFASQKSLDAYYEGTGRPYPPGLFECCLEIRPPIEQVCELAERIDSFLKGLPRETPLGLILDARNDLSLLLILADWCEDHGHPVAAQEARHLHGLVRVQLL